MPVTQQPNFVIRSTTGYEHKLLRYNDYGAIALLESNDKLCRFVLVKDMHPINGGKHAWNYVNAFSERSAGVREFEAECWLARRAHEDEQ